ncbi:MAG: autotransporter assembly complex protein TamA [Pseudomonadales bacterium]|nr:autotransporter assembly complex protein TamA [Pseudomonadales bacterium]
MQYPLFYKRAEQNPNPKTDTILHLPRLFFLLLFACFFVSNGLRAATLTYTVVGVEDELRANVLAWLGDEPETVAERANFVISAEDRVKSSLQALGYYSPDIELTVDKADPIWKLAIDIRAGKPVVVSAVDIQLSGAGQEDSAFDTLLAKPSIKAGDIFHHGKYEALKNRLLVLGRTRGYFDGALTSNRVEVSSKARTAHISLHYASGQRYRFGDIHYDKELIDVSQLEALRTFQERDYYDSRLAQRFQANIQQTNFYSSVVFRPLLDQVSHHQVPMLLELHPAKSHSFDVGLGYSTDTRGRISMIWRTPHLNRYGHSQETRIKYSSINPSAQITYRIPLSHPLNDRLALKARLETDEYGDLESEQHELGALREVKLNSGWLRSYSLRALAERWDVGSLNNDSYYTLPGIIFTKRTAKGSPVNPEAGIGQFYQLEVAGEDVGSEINLLRAYSKVTYVKSLADRHRFVTRGQLGVVLIDDDDRADLSPSLGFIAGGSQSLRGFSYNSIGHEITATQPDGGQSTLTTGGDRLFTASLEYQYRFLENWRAAVFSDYGDAFNKNDFNAHYSAGFGIHYLSAVGALRAEIANSLSEDDPSWYLHLNIGAEF